jgi:hypothetical protein
VAWWAPARRLLLQCLQLLRCLKDAHLFHPLPVGCDPSCPLSFIFVHMVCEWCCVHAVMVAPGPS